MIKNRTLICRDNIEVLRLMPDESIDLIYLDPPFNKNRMFIAPIRNSTKGVKFKDIWGKEDIKDEWLGLIADYYPDLYNFLRGIGNSFIRGSKHYCIYMAIRLLEMKRILKDTGSIYYHCDHTMNFLIRSIMDIIFGNKNFRNEIIWNRNNRRGKIKHQSNVTKSLFSDSDTILLYSKTNKFKLLDIPTYKTVKEFPKKDTKGNFITYPITLNPSQGRRPNQEYTYKGYTPKNGWNYIKASLEKIRPRRLSILG